MDDAITFVDASNERMAKLEARREGAKMGATDKLWDTITTVIRMNDKVERMAET